MLFYLFLKRFLYKEWTEHNTGRSPAHAVGMAGCDNSKIERVRAYYLYCICLDVLTRLQILTVTKYWVTRNESLAVTKSSDPVISDNCYNGKKNTLFRCFT